MNGHVQCVDELEEKCSCTMDNCCSHLKKVSTGINTSNFWPGFIVSVLKVYLTPILQGILKSVYFADPFYEARASI